MTTIKEAKAICAQLGMTFRRTEATEYRVAFRPEPGKSTEDSACYESSIDDAIDTARAMAARRDNPEPFKVEGVDSDDGSRTELASFDNSGEARAFLSRYVSRENAGGWDLIEIYDTRGEDAERIAFWERDVEEIAGCDEGMI